MTRRQQKSRLSEVFRFDRPDERLLSVTRSVTNRVTWFERRGPLQSNIIDPKEGRT